MPEGGPVRVPQKMLPSENKYAFTLLHSVLFLVKGNSQDSPLKKNTAVFSHFSTFTSLLNSKHCKGVFWLCLNFILPFECFYLLLLLLLSLKDPTSIFTHFRPFSKFSSAAINVHLLFSKTKMLQIEKWASCLLLFFVKVVLSLSYSKFYITLFFFLFRLWTTTKKYQVVSHEYWNYY